MSIWESMDGPSEVDLGADLESVAGRFGIHLGYLLECIWGPFGVCVGSILRSDSDSGFRPSRDHISRPLGPILAPLLDPMLAPCRPHVGSCWAWGILERSWSDLEPILRPYLINMEDKTKKRGWILEKLFETFCFSMGFRRSGV